MSDFDGYVRPDSNPTAELPDLPGCHGDYTKPGDGGHSVLAPRKGDFRGDSTVDNGGFFDHPLDTIESAAKRFPSYGNWAGPGNKYEEQIKAKFAKDPSYDPTKDKDYDKSTSVDGLDDAGRKHDLQYYKDNGGPGHEKGDEFFSLEGILNCSKADRSLQQNAAAEMDHPSIGKDGKPTVYSEDSKDYAKGMQGFFGGRADAVDIRAQVMSGKMDGVDALGAAATDVGKAYDKNGILGGVGEGLGIANVAAVQAAHSGMEGLKSLENMGESAVNSVYHMFAD